MKFNQSDIPKMGLAAVVTAVIIVLIMYNKPEPIDPPKEKRISWREAEDLKSTYLKNNPIMVEYPDASGKKVTETLVGFKMSASELEEVINHNQNGTDGNDKADEVMIFLGREITVSGVDTYSNLRVIVAGIQNGSIMKNQDPNNISQSSVFDRADPCPPNHVAP